MKKNISITILLCLAVSLNAQFIKQYQSFNNINNIYQDKTGNMWFSSSEQTGIIYNIGDDWSRYDASSELEMREVYGFTSDANNNTLIASKSGVYLFNGSEFSKLKELSDTAIYIIFIDKVGRTWFGTEKGLAMKDLNNDWVRYTLNNSVLDSFSITAIIEDVNGTIWIGTDNGLFSFKDSNLTDYSNVTSIANNSISNIKFDKQNNLWVAMYQNGVSVLKGNSWISFTESNGLPTNSIWSLSVDTRGTIWLAAGSSGLCKYNGLTWSVLKKADGLSYDYVNSVFSDSKGNVWVSSGGNGVSVYNGTSWSIQTTTTEIGTDYVSEMYEDNNGTIWFADNRNIGRIIKKTTNGWSDMHILPVICDNHIRSIYIDNNDVKWVGSYSGVTKIQNDTIINYPYGGKSIAFDSSGNLWTTSTISGAYKYDGVNWTSYDMYNTEMPYNEVNAVVVDKNDTKWFGTSKGLARLDGTIMTTYTTKDGLIDNYITSLALDTADNIWIGTSAGVSRFDRTNWTNYNKDSGLKSNYVWSLYADSTGSVLVGNIYGLSVYDGNIWKTYTNDVYDVDAVFSDSDGDIWCDGLYRFHNSKWYNYTFSPNTIAIAEDKSGDIWVGDEIMGLFCLNKNVPVLNVDTTKIFIDSKNSSQKIEINSNGSWFIKANSSLSFSQTSGTGSAEIEIQATPYVDELGWGDHRVCYFDVFIPELTTIHVSVEQEPTSYLKLVDDLTELSISNSEQTFSFTIYSYGSWFTNSSVNWLNVSPSSSSGFDIINVDITENTGTTTRTGVITVTNPDVQEPIKITFHQLARKNTALNSINFQEFIYPNPATDILNISNSNQKDIHIMIYNLAGMCIQDIQSNENIVKIPVKDYLPGIYTLQIISEKIISSQFIVK